MMLQKVLLARTWSWGAQSLLQAEFLTWLSKNRQFCGIQKAWCKYFLLHFWLVFPENMCVLCYVCNFFYELGLILTVYKSLSPLPRSSFCTKMQTKPILHFCKGQNVFLPLQETSESSRRHVSLGKQYNHYSISCSKNNLMPL